LIGNLRITERTDIVERVYRHQVEILKKLDAKNPLRTLTFGVQPSKKTQIIHKIDFNKLFIGELGKF